MRPICRCFTVAATSQTCCTYDFDQAVPKRPANFAAKASLAAGQPVSWLAVVKLACCGGNGCLSWRTNQVFPGSQTAFFPRSPVVSQFTGSVYASDDANCECYACVVPVAGWLAVTAATVAVVGFSATGGAGTTGVTTASLAR